jgi:hypothetical protein
MRPHQPSARPHPGVPLRDAAVQLSRHRLGFRSSTRFDSVNVLESVTLVRCAGAAENELLDVAEGVVPVP